MPQIKNSLSPCGQDPMTHSNVPPAPGQFPFAFFFYGSLGALNKLFRRKGRKTVQLSSAEGCVFRTTSARADNTGGSALGAGTRPGAGEPGTELPVRGEKQPALLLWFSGGCGRRMEAARAGHTTPASAHTHLHSHTHTQAPTQTHAHTHTHSCTHMHKLMHTYTDTCTHTYTHTCTHTHASVHRHTLRHRHTHNAHIYTNTHINLHSCAITSTHIRTCMHTGTHIYMNIGSHTQAYAHTRTHTGIHTHQGNKDNNFSFSYKRIPFSFG